MNFFKKSEAAESASPVSASIAPSSASKSMARKEPEAEQPTIRLKAYTGLETKTLWNHFSKDDLMTITEVTLLVDKIVMKDAADVYAAIKTQKAWKDFCAQVLALMDTSQGSTVDLQEFSSEFNTFYLARPYLVVTILVPALHRVLKKICRDANLDPVRLEQCEAVLRGDMAGTAAVDDKEVKRLQRSVQDLSSELESLRLKLRDKDSETDQLRSALRVAEAGSGDMEANLASLASTQMQLQSKSAELTRITAEYDRSEAERRRLEEQRASLSESNQRKVTALESEIASLKSEQEKATSSARGEMDSLAQQVKRLESEKAGLSRTITQMKTDAERATEVSERRLSDLQSQVAELGQMNRELRESQFSQISDWKERFEAVISENESARRLLGDLRGEIVRVNAALLEAQLHEPKKPEVSKASSISCAALSGAALDPFRSELVNQFGSIDAVVGKRKKLTLHEMESIASSLGYSRDYSRKLFYALDVKNRGFLTSEQFGRPLPLLNHELCLLTQASS